MDFIHQIEPYLTEREIESMISYLRSGGWLTEFKKTEEFENDIAEFVGSAEAIVITSGTVGLYLALLAAGIGKGDKVYVPNYTMIATSNAVKWAGAEPVLVDVEADTLCMDIKKIKKADTRAKAMIYVSINGRCADMLLVQKFCSEHKLCLIEDACQSLGSRWKRKYMGTFGDIGVFSFTPHKIITTGQGGAIVTNNKQIAKEIRKLKDFYRVAAGSDLHEGIGFNFKFTDLQAVIGIEQMKIIDYRINRKKNMFRRYQQNLGGLQEITLLSTDLDDTNIWFADIILPSQETREKLTGFLKQHKIGTRSFYPPINHQKPYSYFKRGSFPISESMAYRGLWLPSSIGLDNAKIDFICGKISDFLKNNG